MQHTTQAPLFERLRNNLEHPPYVELYHLVCTREPQQARFETDLFEGIERKLSSPISGMGIGLPGSYSVPFVSLLPQGAHEVRPRVARQAGSRVASKATTPSKAETPK